MATVRPERLHFTENDEADELLAREPLALLIGFVLDQQVSVRKAFSSPLELTQRIGPLDAERIAAMDPAELEAAFRERPALHRFPGAMAARVRKLCATLAADYGGDPERIWAEAETGAELRSRLLALPGIGEMKAKALTAVLAKRFESARRAGKTSCRAIPPSATSTRRRRSSHTRRRSAPTRPLSGPPARKSVRPRLRY